MIFKVVGGDARSAYLCRLLAGDGHTVFAYAQEDLRSCDGVSGVWDFADLTKPCDCVILPLPISLDSCSLNAPLTDTVYQLRDIFSLLPTGQTVVGGKISHELFELAGRGGIRLYDYLEREEFVVKNAVPTAEGAIAIAMEELKGTLHGASCLVIGFGHIGKLLARYLDGLGARVCASARRAGDIAWIEGYGYESMRTDALDSLSRFDVIFNTVPSRVLHTSALRTLSPECLCIDLASKPGGIDFDAAKCLGIRVIWALSLPGKVAPYAAGDAMRQTIYNIVSEWRHD